jgi:hypothetical protein
MEGRPVPIIAIADQARVPGGVRSSAADRCAIADAIDDVPAGTEIVLVSSDPVGWQESRAIRLAFGQELIGLLRVDVPPTAFFLITAALAMLRDDQLGLASATAALASSVSSTQVLLSSVTSLDRPAPRFGQHLASMWPTTRYLVDWDTQSVARAQTVGSTAGIAAVIARSPKSFAEVDERTWPAERVELVVGAAAPWHASRWLEITTLRERLDEVIASVQHPEMTRALPTCRSCARLGWGERCVFCQLPLVDADMHAPVAVPSVGGLA